MDSPTSAPFSTTHTLRSLSFSWHCCNKRTLLRHVNNQWNSQRWMQHTCLSLMAADSPAGPAPTIHTSYSIASLDSSCKSVVEKARCAAIMLRRLHEPVLGRQAPTVDVPPPSALAIHMSDQTWWKQLCCGLKHKLWRYSGYQIAISQRIGDLDSCVDSAQHTAQLCCESSDMIWRAFCSPKSSPLQWRQHDHPEDFAGWKLATNMSTDEWQKMKHSSGAECQSAFQILPARYDFVSIATTAKCISHCSFISRMNTMALARPPVLLQLTAATMNRHNLSTSPISTSSCL